MAANVIATSMYAQCDPDGHEYVMFDSLVDFRRSDDALRPEDQKVLKADGRSYMRRTTAGWELCVLWKDGSTTWENLSEMKESYPIECAEYAVSQSLQEDPTFNYWVSHVLKSVSLLLNLSSKEKQQILCCFSAAGQI